MFGIYILTFCAVAVGITVLASMGYHTVKATYWLITDQIDWNITNVAMALWCILAMIGILCLIIGIFQTL